MIDTVKIRVPFRLIHEEEWLRRGYQQDRSLLRLAGLDFTPTFPSDKTISRFTGKWKIHPGEHSPGLYIVIYPESFTISNSLQTFWHGHNYGDFAYSDLCECILTICDRLGFDPAEGEILRITPGVNLPRVDVDLSLYDRMIEMRGRKPDYMRLNSGGQTYGTKFVFSEFAIKTYNKTIQVAKKYKAYIDDTIRIEMEITKKGYILRNLPLRNLSDLLDQEKLLTLFTHMMDKMNENIIIDCTDYSKLTRQELAFLALLQNHSKRKFYQDNYPYAYRREKSKLHNKIKDIDKDRKESFAAILAQAKKLLGK